MRRRVGFLACLVGFACLIFAGLLAAVHVVGTDAELYHELQMKAGILDFAGISEEDLVVLDEALADCLKGNPDAFQSEPEWVSAIWPLKVEVFGELQPAFNEKELIHMEDCRQLFILLRTVLTGTAVLSVGFLACGIYLLCDRKWIRLAAWIAPLLIAVPLGLFAAWAVMDFNAAFNFFHKILFTNDLWLLDARTDLLIRICPASMFMSMGVRIGLMGLAWALIVPALTTAFTVLKKERI